MAKPNNTLEAQVEQFIKEHYFLQSSEGGEVFIVAKYKFERVDHADTYNDYGQTIGHEDAQDNHVRNSYSALGERYLAIANDYEDYDEEEWEEGTKEWHSKYVADQETKLSFQDWLASEMQVLYATEEVCNTCLAYDYWDGHNWQSIVIANSDDFGILEFTGYEELSDTDAQEIAEEFFSKEYHRNGFGTNEYVSDNYVFIDSYCQGAWADWVCADRELEEVY